MINKILFLRCVQCFILYLTIIIYIIKYVQYVIEETKVKLSLKHTLLNNVLKMRYNYVNIIISIFLFKFHTN